MLQLRFLFTISALLVVCSVALIGLPSNAVAITATGSDNRIQTFIYGKNDVFKVVTTYGYQTLIELEEDEKILTISLGDPSPFKLTTQRNKIFLKALIEGQLTNMTLITNKRTYHMELSSIIDDIADIMYVVRFFYPESIQKEISNAAGGSDELKNTSGDSNKQLVDGAFTLPKIRLEDAKNSNTAAKNGSQHARHNTNGNNQSTPPNSSQSLNQLGQNNYNYMKNGSSSAVLASVYDDGSNTYISLKSGMVSSVHSLLPSNKELPVNFVQKNKNSYMINSIYDRVIVRLNNGGIICLYKMNK